MKVLRYAAALIVLSQLLISSAPAMDEGLDEAGNRAIDGAPFAHWEGVMAVINDQNRVYYYRWGRGRAGFYFQGDTKDLNAALVDFSKIKAEPLDVVLRPGPGKAETFRSQHIPCNWRLKLPNRWVVEMDPSNVGHLVWDDHPVLTVYVGGDIELQELKIPKNLRIVQLAELQARYAQAVKPEIPYHIVSAAADNIAELDPYNPAAMYRIAKLLTHEKLAVRNHASRAIARFGSLAKPAIKQLKAAAKIERYPRPLATTSIDAIKAAQEDPEAKAKHQAILKEISAYVESLPKQ